MVDLTQKLAMDPGQIDGGVDQNRGATKHVGFLTETQTPDVILFRTVPNEPNNCLVAAPKFLSSDYQDRLQKAVESAEGQAANELGEYLGRQRFADNVNILEYLHNNNFIKKMPTSNITVTHGIGDSNRIVLADLNKEIAAQKGVAVEELAVQNAVAEEDKPTTIATVKEESKEDAKAKKKK